MACWSISRQDPSDGSGRREPFRRGGTLLSSTMHHCNPDPQPSDGAPRDPGTPAEQQWDGLYGELQPVVQRLLLQYPGAPDREEELRGAIRRRYFELVEAHDPASGAPLRPFLVRMLTAWVYTVACHGGDLAQAEERFKTELARTLAASPGAMPGPDEELEAAEGVLTMLPGAVSRLPWKQKLVVIGRYYESRSCEEMAAALDIEPEAVRLLLRRALARLRRQLGEEAAS